jgi:hypothetical protein
MRTCFLLTFLAVSTFAQTSPCENAEAKAFDWQIGVWQSEDGKQVHEIKKLLDSCVIQETWKTEGIETAVALKSFDDGRHNKTGEKKWFYSWVAKPFHQLWEGRKESEQWRFYRNWFSNGEAVLSRTYWTQISADKLERIVEQSRDEGKTWKPWVKDAFNRVTQAVVNIEIEKERKFFDFLIGEWRMEKLVAQGETGIGGDDVFKFRKTLDGNGIFSEWYFNRGTTTKPNFIEGEYTSAFDNNSKTWSFYYISPFVSQFYQGLKENGNWWFYKDYNLNGDKFTQRQAWEKIDENTILRIIENSRDGGKTWQRGYAATLKRVTEKTSANLSVRNAHALVYDENVHKIILFGGADSEKVLNDTWEFDGTKWSLVSTNNSPSPRTFPAMTYDSVRKKILLFGGNRVLFGKDDNDYEFFNDFWEFDGKVWTKINVPTPDGRAEASFIFDRQRQKAVLFGGYRIENGAMKPLSDTWEWDGKSWQKMAEGTPTAKSGAAIAYDEQRKKVVLFGGGIRSGGANETWEWDGKSWAEINSAKTEPRYNSTMVYDSNRNKITRFGGWDGTKRVSETWEFDGKTWTRLNIESPEARNHTVMVYDTKRRKIILFGGHNGDFVFGETWEFDGKSWRKIISVEPQKRIENGH